MKKASPHPRRQWIHHVAALTATVASGRLAAEPSGAVVRLVVPFPPGGPTDSASRIVGKRMSDLLGSRFVVDNRAGASGTIGANAVAKARPDGLTVMMLATPVLLAPHLYPDSGYDVRKAFTPIGTVYDLPIVIVVNPQVVADVNDLASMIRRAKQENGRLPYTTAGVGSFGHLSMESLKLKAGFRMDHVPYRGSAPAIADVVGGQIGIMFADLVAALPHIQSGRLRAIAVGSARRVSLLPDVKTIAEQGYPDFDAVSWGGLMAPAGTPASVIESYADALKRTLDEQAIRDGLLKVGAFANWQSPTQMAERIRTEDEQWGRVIRDAGIKVQ